MFTFLQSIYENAIYFLGRVGGGAEGGALLSCLQTLFVQMFDLCLFNDLACYKTLNHVNKAAKIKKKVIKIYFC